VAARDALGIPNDGRYLGIAGLLNAKKGVDRLLRAFQSIADRVARNDRLLLAGPVDEETRTLIEQDFRGLLQAGKVVLLDRSLSTGEVNLAIAAMDVVCTPYPRHIHSASIVIRAAAAGRPVLGSNSGWMEHSIRLFSLGDTTSVADENALAEAIVQSLESSPDFAPTEAARRFVAYHSAANFAGHWTAFLRERLARPAVPLVEWDWVLAGLAR
jgi:glycosyltransferase involved in cell wall biosynthesis